MNDPYDEDVKFLVDYNARQIVLTSGAKAETGDNTGWAGSVVIIDYQRSSPLISIKSDSTSQENYGTKNKVIIDRSIKDIYEANIRATTFLAEHKDPRIQGTLEVEGIVDVTPGEKVVVNIPFHNVNSQTYAILNANYTFNKTSNLSDQVLKVTVNKRIRNLIDYMKEQELRLRSLEGGEVDTSITNVASATGSFGVTSSGLVIQRSIGSAFYFHIPGHNMLNNSSSLLGDMRAGSIIGGLT